MPIAFRRAVLAIGSAAALGAAARKAAAQGAAPRPTIGGPSYPFVLPPLPYASTAAQRYAAACAGSLVI